jgi:hypothetical protein
MIALHSSSLCEDQSQWSQCNGEMISAVLDQIMAILATCQLDVEALKYLHHQDADLHQSKILPYAAVGTAVEWLPGIPVLHHPVYVFGEPSFGHECLSVNVAVLVCTC